ncbi:hypothetical protein GGX14DRAFT_698347 [Mycena pura]|uniref:DUF6533 domain-containing protein n=1 Tax=Mycena pura TaxID=153505 RepID=A0AAD6V9V6_9AGAR|nr:hypothetical protein GGX14DRAFT_698347 [Mycena pura]
MEYGTVELANETIRLNSLHLMAISILYWDHLLTLDNEIRFLWMQKKTTSSVWFFLVRYLGFAGNIPVVIFSFMSISPKVRTTHQQFQPSNAHTGVSPSRFWAALELMASSRCLQYSLAHQIVLVVTQIVISVVMSIRIYALYDRNNRLLACLVMLGTCLVAICFWTLHHQHVFPFRFLLGCHPGISQSTGYHLSASWVVLFLFDSLMFGLMLYKTYTTWRSFGGDLPLHILIMRDGALYFVVMAFANLANIATYYLAGVRALGPLLPEQLSELTTPSLAHDPRLALDTRDLVGQIIILIIAPIHLRARPTSVSVSMMCRLMLNLHGMVHFGILSPLRASNSSITLNICDQEDYPALTPSTLPLFVPESHALTELGPSSTIHDHGIEAIPHELERESGNIVLVPRV